MREARLNFASILNGGWCCIEYNAFLSYKLKNSYFLEFWRLVRALDIYV